MKKISFHILFWIFIAFYVFDYFIDNYSLKYSISYTLYEVFIFSIEFYINLFILLPFFLENKKRLLYYLSLLLLLSSTCFSFFIIDINKELLGQTTVRAIISFALNHALFILISYFVWHFNKYELEKQKRLLLENEKLQAEMLLLKTQISPHFLFNALNNIYALTLLKSDDAHKMLSTLSDILRYFLYEGNKHSVFLDSEIGIISKYIQIQKYRQIPGMNNIKLTVIGNTAGLKVPPLLYMTLLENAFKHGDIIEKEEGFIDIKFTITNNDIELIIENSYSEKEKSNGIGLKNIKSQLDILYGSSYKMDLNTENNTFKIKLTLHGI